MKRPIFILNTLICLVGMTISIMFSSCASDAHFLTSAVVPAAEGTVHVNKDKNKNFVIKIKLHNLADSKRLTPPMNTYVVWMVNADNLTKNMGQIISSTGFISKNLNANFETVSTSKPIKVFITSEDDASVTYPSFSHLILTTGGL